MTTVQSTPDPWEDDKFSQLDLRTGPEHFASELAEIANSNPDQFAPPPEPVVETPLTPVVETPVIPQYAQPETVTMDDGSSVEITNDVEGWHATVNPGGGKTLQIYHAHSERDLLKALAVAQANATKKINQQEKQIKLIRKMDEPQTPASTTKELTADQIFEIKTLQQSDPVAAWKKTIELTTGLTWEEFVNAAKDGRAVKQEMTRNQIAGMFFEKRPAYQKTKANEGEMLKYLADNKKDFTVENLMLAYDDLMEAGLLPDVPKSRPVTTVVTQPNTEPAAIPVVPEVAVTPVTPPANPRIERPAGRANAALGLRANETTTVRPLADQRAPSVEELNELPDDEITRLFAGVIRAKAQSARRP